MPHSFSFAHDKFMNRNFRKLTNWVSSVDEKWMGMWKKLAPNLNGAPGTLWEQADEIERLIFELVNHIRDRYGRQTLYLDIKVAKAARLHSEDMAARNYYSHDSPEGSDFGRRLTEEGVSWSRCTENIAKYSSGRRTLILGLIPIIFPLLLPAEFKSNLELAETAVDGWLNSEGHRQNMLDASIEKTGVGVAVSRAIHQYTVYFTQDFC